MKYADLKNIFEVYEKYKSFIRIGLIVVIAFLAYLTFDTVNSDLVYAEEVEVKEGAVIAKLEALRDAQLLYKDVNGKFANTYEELFKFLEEGTVETMILEGDKDDSTTVFSSRAIEFSIKDSLYKDVDINSLKFLPGTDTAVFIIAAGEIKKNNVVVPVFEIKDPYPFNKERVKKNDPLTVGSLFEVNYNGNWK
ncbi:MAG: hypothetical protein O3C19_00590 [Bacteroidetes bacterium]|nr:hypothetical protein [Bacteroidota bacterium]